MYAFIIPVEDRNELRIPKIGLSTMLAMEWMADSDVEGYLQYIKHDGDYFYLCFDWPLSSYVEMKDYINRNQ